MSKDNHTPKEVLKRLPNPKMWPEPSLAVIMELNVSKIQIEYGECGSHQVKARVVIYKDELRDTLKKLFKDTDAIERFINE